MPRVLFVARDPYRLPLAPGLARKWDALSERMDLRVLASGSGSDPRFVLRAPTVLDGLRFYASLPTRIARQLRVFHPDVVVAQSPFEAVAAETAVRLARSRAKVVVEAHGDWHTSTRLYGSRARRLAGPVGDRVARFAVGRADASRAVSSFTASLLRDAGSEPAAVFTTYSDIGAFTGPFVPVPVEPRVIFVGVLERYKNIEGLAEAWRIVRGRVPEARLHLVGNGTQSEIAKALVREGVEWETRLEPEVLAAAVDRARALILPSASEGLPRVAIEAFARGRAVVGSRAGGIPDIVENEVSGLLVPYGDSRALAAAVERIVTDHDLAVRLGAGAAAAAPAWVSSPDEYADRVLALVQGVVTG